MNSTKIIVGSTLIAALFSAGVAFAQTSTVSTTTPSPFPTSSSTIKNTVATTVPGVPNTGDTVADSTVSNTMVVLGVAALVAVVGLLLLLATRQPYPRVPQDRDQRPRM